MNRQASAALPDDTKWTPSVRGRLPDGRANPIDAHVGRRIRQRRVLLGMSQENLANTLGVTFQQIQKYEYAANRVGASRLWQLSVALDCPVSYFFDDLDRSLAVRSEILPVWRTYGLSGTHVPDQSYDGDSEGRSAMLLLRAYNAIQDTRIRQRVYELAKSLAATGTSQGEESPTELRDGRGQE